MSCTEVVILIKQAFCCYFKALPLLQIVSFTASCVMSPPPPPPTLSFYLSCINVRAPLNMGGGRREGEINIANVANTRL